MPKNESIKEALARVEATLAEARARFGGVPAPPLTEEELDRSETEIRNWLRRGQRLNEEDDNE